MPQTINSELALQIINNAYLKLKAHEKEINNLNVFPVPDGDTGTNMLLTMNAVVSALGSHKSIPLPELAEIATKSALMGARGNSGVILSQIIKGFFKPVKEDNIQELGLREIVRCFESSREAAYRAVNKPVEGTMLTIIARASAAAKKLKKKRNITIEQLFEGIVKESEIALQETPEMLPILKSAGVVDAGGLGLVVILKAALDTISGRFLPAEEVFEFGEKLPELGQELAPEEIGYTFCTEVLVTSETMQHDLAVEFLNSLGDSVLVIKDGDVVKAHVHTDKPLDVLNYFNSFGEFIDIKVNNMRLQTEEANRMREEKLKQEIEPQEKVETLKTAIVAVVQGEGLKQLFKSIGCSEIVEGGQTMNPSAEVILRAIEKAPSSQVFVLPNNKNIILAAEQAAKMSSKSVKVITSKSIQQGFQAVLVYNPEADFEENERKMLKAINEVISVNITRSVRDATINGQKIKEGDYLGIIDGEIVESGNDLALVLVKTLEKAITDEVSFMTVFAGKELSQDDLENIDLIFSRNFPDLEHEIKYGGQEHYQILLAIER